MFAIVLITYRVPLDEVERHTEDHRAYLRGLHAQGKLIAAGPLVPRTGGALLLHGDDRAEIDGMIAQDPFLVRNVATYDVREWAPGIGREELEKARERPLA